MKRTHSFVIATASLLVVLPGCRRDDDPTSSADGTDTDAATDTGADDTGDSGGVAAMTFWDDVAPLYFDNCVTCHREGGIAPFSLDNYQDAVAWSAATTMAVSNRTMPPWLVNGDGSCGEFADSRALQDDEIDTIVAWIESDQDEGTPRDDLEIPTGATITDTTQYSTPNFVPEIVGGPLAEFDEYRCFVLEPGADHDTFLTGYDVIPGNEAVVHHVLGIVLDPDGEGEPGLTNRETIEAYDAESPDRAGWPCFEGAGPETEDKSIPIVWAPGQGAVSFPNNSGIEVAEGDIIVAQVHYNLSDPATLGQSDQTIVNIRYDDDVENPGFMLLPDLFLETLYEPEPASLAPGQDSVQYTWDIPLGFVFPDFGVESMKLYGVLPHMHEYGQQMQMRLDGDAGEECAVEVGNWDFNWQLMYFYDEPMQLTSDQTLSVTCDYNTQNAEGPITPGWGTQNEMCLMGLFLVPD